MEDRQSIMVGCAHCGARNRIPKNRTGEKAVCGKCRSPLSLEARYPDHPVVTSDRTFTKEVLNFPGPVLVYYWGSWCPYCQRMTPIVEQIARDYSGKIKVVKIILDQNPVTGSQYDIQSVPTILLFKKGKHINRIVGAHSRQEVENQLHAIL